MENTNELKRKNTMEKTKEIKENEDQMKLEYINAQA
jgi:hypothetical protein